MALITKREDGSTVQGGDMVHDHRGTPWVYVAATDTTRPGHSGKVLVTPEDGGRRREFFAHVFDLTVTED